MTNEDRYQLRVQLELLNRPASQLKSLHAVASEPSLQCSLRTQVDDRRQHLLLLGLSKVRQAGRRGLLRGLLDLQIAQLPNVPAAIVVGQRQSQSHLSQCLKPYLNSHLRSFQRHVSYPKKRPR